MNARAGGVRRAPRGLGWAWVSIGLAAVLAMVLMVRDGRAASASSPSPASAPASTVAAKPTASAASTVPLASAAPPAAASTVAPASASTSATSAVTGRAPQVRSASSAPALSLPPRPACIADASDPDRCGPLTLERDPVTLPDASLGGPYARAIRAEGGLPPYAFNLWDGNLPAGLSMDARGRITGTPSQAGRSRFRVRVVDAAGAIVSQTYSLRVLGPAARAPKPASAASAAATQLSQLDLSQAGPPANAAPTARVYQLDPATLDALKAAIKPDPAAQIDSTTTEAAPEPAAAASAPLPAPPPNLAWSDAQQTQLEALLKPVMAVEYPTQVLFEAAVDAQVCAQAWQLIVHEAQRLKQQPPSQATVSDICAASAAPAPQTSSAKPSARSASAAPSGGTTQPMAWRDLPGWLMPQGLRNWLVEAATRDRLLLPDKSLPWTAVPLCNCAAPRTAAPLFAVYPTWLADGKQPQAIDFSLVNRITYFALPMDNEQAIEQAKTWTENQTAFIRTARAYETSIDLGIYQADWRFLATEPAAARDAQIRQFTTQVPRHAREVLDRPLPGLASSAKAWLPGFGQVQRTGDGITIFFDRLPDPDREPVLAARFADFLPRFVKGLAQAMRETPERKYAINLVMTDRQVTNQPGPFEVARLFDLLKAVEEPDMADGRIVETNGDYKRNSNIEMRFLVLMTEPTGTSKKTLRSTIEAGAGLFGSDRRILLRSVVPLLLLPQASVRQYRDDLVYMQNNFGGMGFWPTPLMGGPFDADQAKALRNTFGPETGAGAGEALCSVVCPNRWIFRLVFELLLLVGAVCWLLLQWNCEWRARYGRYALLAGVPPVLVGAALVQCDPALEAVRKSNASLVALVAIPLIAAIWMLLKRKEDKP